MSLSTLAWWLYTWRGWTIEEIALEIYETVQMRLEGGGKGKEGDCHVN